MRDIELACDRNAPEKYDGDMNRLYKRVQKILKLEATRADINDPLKQVLSGLSAVVAGIASARNSMSDVHARS